MQNIPSLVVSAVSTWDGKALAKGEKQIGTFSKGVSALGKTLAATFGAAAMLSYGKNAVRAFAENEKSAKRLETVLKNLGLSFDIKDIEKNLETISAKFGYEGEVLREAFQKLITATGSTTKSQELLNLSLDVAAGSGQDLLTVNQDLAALYVGNTKGLRKYNLGLSQTELQTLSFNDAVKLLSKTFAGAGTAELETFSGQMRVLKEATDAAQESIGTGLVTAFQILAGDGGIEGATSAITRFGETSRDVLIGTASYVDKLLTKLNKLGGKGGGFDWVALIPILGGYLGKGGLIDVAAAEGRSVTGKDKQFGGVYADQYNAQKEAAAAKARAKAEAAAAKRQKELLAMQKKQALAEKNKLSLSKAAAVFDTNRISIAAALRATYDKDTILRLEALQAIENDNGELALKKINELAALQKNADMAKLAGITEISNATLEAINTQLLTELKAINDSKMAESDKEVARQIAFGKYNEAITKAGELAAKESYSERVQIQLTEIAKLASLSKTSNAALTLNKLRESEEISMIERIARAQKAADDARLKALQDYNNALAKVGTGSTATPSGGGDEVVYTIPKNTTDFTLNNPDILKLFKDGIELGSTDTVAESFSKAINAGATLPAAISGARYQARAEQEYAAFLDNISLSNAVAQGSLMQGLESGLSLSASASGARYAAQAARSYNITINAGAIASQDEFTTLLQDTVQKINRDGDPLFVAGTL
jgi:hypothetical protein